MKLRLKMVSTLFCVAAIMALACLRGSCDALPPSNYDTGQLPISTPQLQQDLTNNCQNALDMFCTVRRAIIQDKADVAFQTLQSLRAAQPHNAIVLSAYCYTMDGETGNLPLNGYRVLHELSTAEDADYAQTLALAYKCDPNLWMTYLVQGTALLGLRMAGKGEAEGYALVKRSVELGPTIPFTHEMLASAYARPHRPFFSYTKAAAEAEKAVSLAPPDSVAAWTLFQIYSLLMPNAEKEISAKRLFLSMRPPESLDHMSKAAKQWLDAYPG